MRTMATDPVEEVYRQDHDRLWRSLVAYTGDPDLAGEAEAEAFSQLLARGSEVIHPRAWIWHSAFRIAAGLLADRGRHHTADSEIAHWDRSLVDFLSLLGTLSDQQRAAVVLRYAGGFKPGEIAELLGTTSGTVRVQLHRAHAHLRERIAGGWSDE